MTNEKIDGDNITYEDMQITQDNMHIHLGYMRKDISEIKTKLCRNYVTKEEFLPIKRFVYGIVGLMGVGIVGLFVKLALMAFKVESGG